MGITYNQWMGELARIETDKQKIKDKNPCPNCGSTDIRSRGFRWCCASCGRAFLKVKRPIPKVIPPKGTTCPECGDIDLRSDGKFNWNCYSCGRRFRKVKRPIYRILIPEGTICPECEGIDFISKGHSWLCKSCGRSFRKIRRKKALQ